MKNLKFIIFLIVGFLISLNYGFSVKDSQVVVNSQEWEDVYSASIYSNLVDSNLYYLSLETDVNNVIKVLDKNKKILLVENINNKIVPNLKYLLESKGFEVVKNINGNSNLINSRLFQEGDFENVIFVDDRSSYNLISAISFANYKNSYVIFLNEEYEKNYDISQNKIEQSYFIGSSLTNNFKESLDGFELTKSFVFSDKYELNQKIITEINLLNKVSSVILSPGDVLEKDVLEGVSPVLLMGKNQVPRSVFDFINKMNFNSAILIGVDNLQNARLIREKTGIEILVKISKAVVSGNPSDDKALEREKLQIFKIIPKESKLNIIDIIYNKATQEFILKVENLGESEAYFKSGIFIEDLDEDVLATTGSTDLLRLLPGEVISQKIKFDENNFLEKQVKVLGQIFYGESEVSIDKEVKKKMDLEIVSILDSSEVEIGEVIYNDDTKRFEIEVKNIGDRSTYVVAKLKDLMIDDEVKNYVSKNLKINSGESINIKIKVFMDKVSLADNEKININLKYGEKEEILIKDYEELFDYQVFTENSKFPFVYIIVILSLIIIIILLFVNINNQKNGQYKKKRKNNNNNIKNNK